MTFSRSPACLPRHLSLLSLYHRDLAVIDYKSQFSSRGGGTAYVHLQKGGGLTLTLVFEWQRFAAITSFLGFMEKGKYDILHGKLFQKGVLAIAKQIDY